MSRRLIAAAAAVLLAGLAGVLVLTYVSGADARAMEGMAPTTVYTVTEPVPEGTAAEALAEYVAREDLPANAVVPGGVSDLDALTGQVTNAALVPGEQLLAARFSPPEEDEHSWEIPEGYHQVSVQLPANRVIGGHLQAGDTVGLFVSDDGETHLRLHKVLVVRVQGGAVPVQAEEGEESVQAAIGRAHV